MSDSTSPIPSHPLLLAALSGLMCVSPSACGSSKGGTDEIPNEGIDTPMPATECETGHAATPKITSEKMVALTQSAFEQQCKDAHGIFEIQPNCGGSNACRGMSYDANTETLTQHTCRGVNTCAGFSCVVCD